MNKILAIPSIGLIAIFGIIFGLMYEQAYAIPSSVNSLPEIGDEVIISATGVAKCEKHPDFCGAGDIKSRFNLKVTDLAKTFPNGMGKGQISVNLNSNVVDLTSSSLKWATFPYELTTFPSCVRMTIDGPMQDSDGNTFLAAIEILNCYFDGTSMATPAFMDATFSNSDSIVISSYQLGRSSFMDYTDDYAIATSNFRTTSVSEEPHQDQFNGSKDAIYFTTHGISKCETSDEKYCGSSKVIFSCNLEQPSKADTIWANASCLTKVLTQDGGGLFYKIK